MSDDSRLETDPFLDALKELLEGHADVPELTTGNVAVWHHGETDPDEDIAKAVSRFGGVCALVYDLGGAAPDEDDFIDAEAVIELYVDTTKRNRRANPDLRLGGQIRDSIMRAVHRSSDLRNVDPNFDCRVKRYQPLADAEYAAWRITVSHAIYL